MSRPRKPRFKEIVAEVAWRRAVLRNLQVITHALYARALSGYHDERTE